jgi:aryl-alcohol dehydrogenase-like predicted oxidoreductase
MEIGLGTVQLGLPYGNKRDLALMPASEAFAILEHALQRGIQFFDTAIAYGESESRIGSFDLKNKCPSGLVSTKIPTVQQEIWSSKNKYLAYLRSQMCASADRLKIDRHKLLQLHQCDVDFLSSESVIQSLEQIKNEGLFEELGVSVYTLDQAFAAISTGIFKVLQVPANLIDTRFLHPEFLMHCQRHGIKLIIRSAVMQGVLVSGVPVPPVAKAHLLAKLKKMIEGSLIEAGLKDSLQATSLRFLKQNHHDSAWILLIGVDSVSSLRENLDLLESFSAPIPDNLLELLKPARQYAEANLLLNPSQWND